MPVLTDNFTKCAKRANQQIEVFADIAYSELEDRLSTYSELNDCTKSQTTVNSDAIARLDTDSNLLMSYETVGTDWAELKYSSPNSSEVIDVAGSECFLKSIYVYAKADKAASSVTVQLLDKATNEVIESATATVGTAVAWCQATFTGTKRLACGGKKYRVRCVYAGDKVYWNKNVYWDGEVPPELITNKLYKLYTGLYYTSGTFINKGAGETSELDLGSTPTTNGLWQFSYTVPIGTSLTFTAKGSATGAFAGEETTITGTIADGVAITQYFRYYKVTATFVPNGARTETPELLTVKVNFSNICKVCYRKGGNKWGYAPIIKNLPKVKYEINPDIKTNNYAKVGKIQLSLLNDNNITDDLLTSAYLKGKPVEIKLGYSDNSFSESDLLTIFRGYIDTISVKDKSIDIDLLTVVQDLKSEKPTKEEASGVLGTTYNFTLTTDTPAGASNDMANPIYAKLHILQNIININDSLIEVGDFDKTLTTRKIRRVVTDTTNWKEELEFLDMCLDSFTVCYENGKVGHRTATAATTEVDYWDGAIIDFSALNDDLSHIYNICEVPYGYDQTSDKDTYSAYDGWIANIQDPTATSKVMNLVLPNPYIGPVASYAGAVLATAVGLERLNRVKYGTPILEVNTGIEKAFINLVDVISVDTSRYIRPFNKGIHGGKFLVVSKEYDLSKLRINWKLLRLFSTTLGVDYDTLAEWATGEYTNANLNEELIGAIRDDTVSINDEAKVEIITDLTNAPERDGTITWNTKKYINLNKCDSITGWEYTVSAPEPSINTTTYVYGNSSLNIGKTGTASDTVKYWVDTSKDISGTAYNYYTYVRFDNINKLASSNCVEIQLGTNFAVYYYKRYNKADFTNNTWKKLGGALSGFSKAGTPNDASINMYQLIIIADAASTTADLGTWLMDSFYLEAVNETSSPVNTVELYGSPDLTKDWVKLGKYDSGDTINKHYRYYKSVIGLYDNSVIYNYDMNFDNG